MTELIPLIIALLGNVVAFGLIVRSNQIDDRARLKKIFMRNLKTEGRGTAPPTSEKVY